MAANTEDLEAIANQLDAHLDYKVLRRYKPRGKYVEPNPGESVFRGLFLDIETTGLDTVKASAIELGMVPFDYSSAGQVLRIYTEATLSQLNDPGVPIPEEIVRLTGITNEMVAGQAIDHLAVEDCARDANLIIAHNASFDRPIAERLWPVLANKNWACSVADVPWKDEGVTSAKLDYVAMVLGFFFEGHRAVDDCLAGIEVLARNLPTSGQTVLSALLENARTTTVQISAVGAPFEDKDMLKARGYRWNPGENGHPKAWRTEIPETELSEELEWLGTEIYPQRDLKTDPLPIEKITAKTRYMS
jgi:DNA polymerase III subunit epsilon